MNAPENATHESQTASSDIHKPVLKPIAPIWHTVVLIVIVLGFSLSTANSQRAITMQHGRILLYVSTMIWEWLLVGYILLGVRSRGVRLRELIGGRWASISDVLRDIGISVGFWLVAMAVLAAVGYGLGLANANAAAEAKEKLGFLVPRSTAELGLFLGVSATAGFCEEIIFRGYLQRQFAAWTRIEIIGVILQAAVFGAGHGYEGKGRMLLIAVYGVLFGLLALWRKSLRPGMIAHGLHDSVEGVLLHMGVLR